MKNKNAAKAPGDPQAITTPYSENHPPKTLPQPESIKLDMEYDEDVGAKVPSQAEVILNKYIAPGFVHDFVLALRGTETPTLFCIWGALFAVSSVMQRRSWLDWVITHLYPNLYLIYIARPGLCKKSVSILFGSDVIARTRDVFTAPDDKEIFPLPQWHGGTTPEYLFDLLAPQEVLIDYGALGGSRPHNLGSRLAIVADELSEFLGKQKYNQGMISRLTKLYDCPRTAKVGTKKDKVQEVKDVFVNFFGGTTPDSFRDAIPAEAHGGGLMSRCIIAWQKERTRSFPIPVRLEGIPDTDELARRLAWIAEHRMGAYRLTDDAYELYAEWYERNKNTLSENSDSDTRADILLIKTAHLIALSRYEVTQHIQRDDMDAAMYLIDLASKQKTEVEEKLLVSEGWHENITTVERVIKRKGNVSRADLLRAVSYKMNADEVNRTLTSLAQSSKVAIFREERRLAGPSGKMTEEYQWIYESEQDE